MFRDKKILSWSLYDWANSSFATTVMAGFFPIMFKDFWSYGADPVVSTARLSSVLAIAGFIMAVMAPLLGAVADTQGNKKRFVFLFMCFGVISTAGLFLIAKGEWMMAALLYGLGMIGFYSSNVFYDSLLPSIATGERANEASSFGFALGYLGGGVLFGFNVLMSLKPELFGFSGAGEAARWAFLTVAIWWFVFSMPLFLNVPEPALSKERVPLGKAIANSFAEVFKTMTKIRQFPNLMTFLIAYWLYIDGVYTVITMAVDYGKSLNFQSEHLIAALLITQFVGFPFAIIFGKLSLRFGCRKPILFALATYMAVVLFAVQMDNVSQFYILAAVIGMVQGGVQALSRSLFSNMIPPENAAEYFGFFNLVGKFASVIGPFVVGVGAIVTGNSRYGMLGLIILFIIGGGLLLKVKEPVFTKDAV